MNINDSSFSYNLAFNSDDDSLGFGGAIYSEGETILNNCKIHNNSAEFGGGVYFTPQPSDNSNTSIKLNNVDIYDNSATENGGGLYISEIGTCLAEGTLVTMHDGTNRKIESIKEGDLIKTFNHETGKVEFSKVNIVYMGKDEKSPFTLNFTNNNHLSIVGIHDLLEKESLKYISITDQNVEKYIGKYFYNANDNRWEKLLSVNHDDKACKYYSIYTEGNFNCVTNNMLTVPDDSDYILNVFDMNIDLKYDETKKQADIEKYGLFSNENCKYVSKEEFDNNHFEYIKVAIGKGLITFDKALSYYLEGQELKKSSSKKSIVDFIRDFLMPKKISAEEIDNVALIIGEKGVNITNNKVNDKYDNLFLWSNILLEIDNSASTKDINVGVNCKNIFDVISIVSTKDYSSCFNSDIDYAEVVYNSDKRLEIVKNYDFSEINTNTSEIFVNEVSSDLAKEIANIELYTPSEGDIIIYGGNNGNYKILKSESGIWNTYTESNYSFGQYVIGTIKTSDTKLVNKDTGDCLVKDDGSGYKEYNQGSTTDTTMHIEGLQSEDEGNDVIVRYNNQILKEGRDYQIENGSIKVKLLNSFVSTLPIGNNKIICKIFANDYLEVYKFELDILIKEVIQEKQYTDTTCETVIGRDWTWDDELGVCKLKGYRIVNTSTN